MQPELHLFIIWRNARSAAPAILELMAQRFTLLEVYEVRWSEKHYSSNLSRFYGQKLPSGSDKEVHCGRGPFLLVLVLDKNPLYERRNTSRGERVVNVTTFDAKERYRSMTGGGHRIHGTNSPGETNHDLHLLTGMDGSAFLAGHTDGWDGRIKPLDRDVTGAGGWAGLEELFATLNAALPYVVLRNFEGFPESALLEGHGDIDLLAESTAELRYIVNAAPVMPEPYRVLHEATVGGRKMLFDFRAVGDNYYDARWEKALIENRVFSPKRFFHPDATGHFYSLLYHAAVHKPSIAPDYVERLLKLAQGIVPLTRGEFADPPRLKKILDDFLARNGYSFVEPADCSVFFNAEFAGVSSVSLPRIFASSKTAGEAIGRVLRQSPDRSNPADAIPAEFWVNQLIRRHFSPKRNALLRFLPLDRGWRVLQFNAESGVSTRYLADRCAAVTAIEQEPDLARAIAIRCDGMRGVDVRAAPPPAAAGGNGYDAVVCPLAWESGEAGAASASARLREIVSFVKSTGRIVLAVDVAGTETAAPGRPPAVRRAAEAVARELRAAGFSTIQRLYPFPNSLAPTAVFSEAAVAQKQFSYGYWAARAAYEAAQAPIDIRTCIAAGRASAAGDLDALCASVCFFAGRGAAEIPPLQWLYRGSSDDAAPPLFRYEAAIAADCAPPLVRKSGTCAEAGCFRFNPNVSRPLYEEHSLERALLALIQDRDTAHFLNLLRQFAQALVQGFTLREQETYPRLAADDPLVRGDALDATPQNVMFYNGEFTFFEPEWGTAFPLPLSFVLYHGLAATARRFGAALLSTLQQATKIPSLRSSGDAVFFLLNGTGACGAVSAEQFLRLAAFDARWTEFRDRGNCDPARPSFLEIVLSLIQARKEGNAHAAQRELQRLEVFFPDTPLPDNILSSTSGADAP